MTLTDPAQDLFLAMSRDQGDAVSRAALAFATPANAQNLISYSQSNPLGSSELGLALATSGIPGNSPQVAQLVNQELETRQTIGPIEKSGGGWWDDVTGIWDEWVDNPIKGGTRWTFAAWDAAYNMFAGGSLIRANQVANQQGIGFGEAFKQQSPAFFEAMGGVLAGEKVNLGSGWMPNSDVADDVRESVNTQMMDVERRTEALPTNEKYAARLQAAPDVWTNAVASSAEQAAMGKPLTQLAAAQAESVMFDVSQIGGGSVKTPWSPGRYASAFVFEPGSENFQKVSGLVDFGAQMFADPAEYLGLWWAKAGIRGRTLFAKADEVAKEVNNGVQMAFDLPDEALQLVDDIPVDETLALADQSKVVVGTPDAYDPYQLDFEGQSLMPDWTDPSTNVRQPGPGDPPDWYRDNVNQKLAEAKRIKADQKAVMHMKGVWTIADEGGRPISIIRMEDGKWMTADEAGDVISVGHKSKNAAVDSLKSNLDRRKVDADFNGMSIEEFSSSGKDFYLDDGVDVLPQQTRDLQNGRPKDSKIYKASAEGTGNTKVRVFGKTADGTRPVDRMPQGLRKALGKDKKIAKGEVRGFGNPNVEKWNATKAWMRENGYGKLKLDDGRYLIVDEYVGGNLNDPMSRVFSPDGTKPISSYGYGLDSFESVTPNEVNEMIDFVSRGGKIPRKEMRGSELSKAQAGRIQDAARQAREAKAALPDVRPDWDELATTNMLTGKRAQLFVDRLAASTKGSGQTNAKMLDDLLAVFEKQGVPVPNSLRNALFDAENADEVQVLFAQWLAREGGGQFVLPGGIGGNRFGRAAALGDTALGQKAGVAAGEIAKTVGSPIETARALTPGLEPRKPRVKLTDKPWLARRIAYGMPSNSLNMLDEAEETYRAMNEILPNFNLTRTNPDGSARMVQLYDSAGELSGETRSVESLFERLRTLEPTQKTEAYELMGDFSEVFFSQLVNDGVDPTLAKNAKRWWGEIADEAIYEAERSSRVELNMGSGEMTAVGEHMVHGLGPQLTAQAWDGTIHMPDAKTIRRVANESDMLGRIANRITSKQFIDETLPDRFGVQKTLQDREWFRFTTGVMNNVWKPFVLLRAAWTIRIGIDDQMRIAAEGYGIFNHPMRVLQYAITQPSDWWTLFKKGQIDINGVKMGADEVSDLAHEVLYRRSLMKLSDEKVGQGAYGYRQTSTVGRESGQYYDGVVTDIKQLRGSPITKVMANSKVDDPVDEAVTWLQGKGPNQKTRNGAIRQREELANLYAKVSDPNDPNNVREAILLGEDRELLYEVVSRQWATLNQKTGGVVYLDDGAGNMRNYGNLDIKETGGKPDGKAKWVVEKRGDPELMSVVAGNSQLYGNLDSMESMGALKSALKTKVKANPEAFPMYARASNVERAGYKASQTETYNTAIRKFFDFFMTSPSNKLSRSPLFHRAYWRKMTELYPYMDDAMQAQVRGVASKANVSIAASKSKKVTRELGEDFAGRLTDMDQADMLAKSHALTQVEKTLFTLTETRRNVSQSLNLIMPFAEAWGEFMSRWGRLMVTGDRAIANARRFQQGIEGSRDSGFFYENEFGQEVFNYPAFGTKAAIGAYNVLNNIPVASSILGEDISQETTDALTQGSMFKPADAGMRQPSSATGSVESLNFASSIIPGFGPVFQMAAKTLMPDDPKWDEVRNIIAPFGTEGNIASSLMPAWAKKIAAAFGGQSDPQLKYQYTSAVQDIIRTQIDAGEWAGLTSQVQINQKVAEAEEQAKSVLLIRAAASFSSPASPQYRFQKQDKNGMVWSYSNLGNEYRKIVEEQNGDEAAAFDVFNERFGLLPHPFIGGRTYAVKDRSRVETGFKFERANPVIFDTYPGTAMYLDPEGGVDGDYDHEATLRQLRLGLREAWTGEQMVYLQQDQLGSLAYSNLKEIASGYQPAERDAIIAEGRSEIKNLYPLWDERIPGKVQGITNDQQIAEVYGWLNDPTVSGTPVAQAARVYLQQRDELKAQIEALGGKTFGSTSVKTEQGQVSNFGRQALRSLAEDLETSIPAFGPLFRNVFEYEVRSELDLVQPEPIEAFGESEDIFAQLLGVGA